MTGLPEAAAASAVCILLSAALAAVLRKRYGSLFRSGAALPLFALPAAVASILLSAAGDGRDTGGISLAVILIFAAGAAVFDVKERIIPFPLSGAAALSAFAISVVCRRDVSIKEVLLASAGGVILGAVVSAVGMAAVRGGLGGGDAAIIIAIGAGTGLASLFWVLAVSFLMTSAAGIFIIARKKGNLKTNLPLAPYLFASVAVCLALKAVGNLLSLSGG